MRGNDAHSTWSLQYPLSFLASPKPLPALGYSSKQCNSQGEKRKKPETNNIIHHPPTSSIHSSLIRKLFSCLNSSFFLLRAFFRNLDKHRSDVVKIEGMRHFSSVSLMDAIAQARKRTAEEEKGLRVHFFSSSSLLRGNRVIAQTRRRRLPSPGSKEVFCIHLFSFHNAHPLTSVLHPIRISDQSEVAATLT